MTTAKRSTTQSLAGVPEALQATVRGCSDDKTAHLKRLPRIEGQVRGITHVVEEDKHCIDVLIQVSAVTELQAGSLRLLEDHLAHGVASAVAAGEQEGAAKLKEASDAIARLVRS